MIPAWLAAADRALTVSAQRIRLIRAVTPINADRELAALEQAFLRGAPRVPCWAYERVGVERELVTGLEALAAFVEGEGPLGLIYAARARELALEAEIIDSIATPRVQNLALRRFLNETPDDDLRAADALADAWTARPEEPRPAEELVRTCDPLDPRSLFSSMAAEVGRQKLPVRVLVQPGLASLAATGDGVILVAAGKRIGAADVARTVLHEIRGHVMPRVRASRAVVAIFALGTARGIDDQEGRALLIERDRGFFDTARTRELGLRHLAARATLGGADFVDVARALLDRGAGIAAAVRIAARVQRGGRGVASGGTGIAREIVYLPAMLRVERALSSEDGATVEAMLDSGRIAVHAAEAVARITRAFEGEPGIASGF
jgi:hypothetical protein